MGYSIGIGEKKREYYEEDDCEFFYTESVELEEAPSWEGDELTGKSNQRYPSYTGFSTFCKEADIYSLFYGKHGILFEHPGFVPLTPIHLNAIKTAKENWIQTHPNTTAGFIDDQDFVLARLLWFEFWMEWALKNCKEPIIHNS